MSDRNCDRLQILVVALVVGSLLLAFVRLLSVVVAGAERCV